MNYYIDLFSPETAKAFSNSERNISGFRISQKTYVKNQNMKSGDRFICYCTRIQRFIGILEITSSPFIDDTPLFAEEDDPFTLRFTVNPIVWLPLNKSIPIHNDMIWNTLSFTK
jgi:predicted RNA-binding protein with PUA-like domain